MHSHLRVPAVVVALLTAISLLAACGGGGTKSTATSSTSAPVREGGDVVFGAEQEPDCADWISSCAGSAWGVYTMEAQTMPRAFDVDSKGAYVPSPLLQGEPALASGPQPKVTYKIDPKAVWSDGTPITSSDFKYTWEQVTTGKDIIDTTGYSEIASVDDSDAHAAVVTFNKPYAAWRDLFGGYFGILPSHLLNGKDRNAEMANGYKWSGGPWVIDHWTKGEEIKLVPNKAYWGRQPHFSSVTFKFLPDSAAEQQAYRTGQVSMLYPQAQPELTQLKSLPDTSFDVASGLSVEGIWLNTDRFPLDDVNVRKAVAFATDRNLIVGTLFGPVKPGIKPLQSFISDANSPYYTDAMGQYTHDPAKTASLMTDAGWTKGSDGVWTKDGKKAELTVRTTAGNKRRELTEQLLQSQWQEAGFAVKIDNQKAGTLFGQTLPAGDFSAGVVTSNPSSADPELCSIFCSSKIPSPANGESGNNWTRINDSKLDEKWGAANSELDPGRRKQLVVDGQKALADTVPAIPLESFPDIVIRNTAVVAGPVGHNPVFGPWVNMNQWWQA